MKRRDLIRKIEEAGAVFIRHGGKYDWYQNPQTKIDKSGLAAGATAPRDQ